MGKSNIKFDINTKELKKPFSTRHVKKLMKWLLISNALNAVNILMLMPERMFAHSVRRMLI